MSHITGANHHEHFARAIHCHVVRPLHFTCLHLPKQRDENEQARHLTEHQYIMHIINHARGNAAGQAKKLNPNSVDSRHPYNKHEHVPRCGTQTAWWPIWQWTELALRWLCLDWICSNWGDDVVAQVAEEVPRHLVTWKSMNIRINLLETPTNATIVFSGILNASALLKCIQMWKKGFVDTQTAGAN